MRRTESLHVALTRVVSSLLFSHLPVGGGVRTLEVGVLQDIVSVSLLPPLFVVN